MSSRKNPTQESASSSGGEGFHLLFEHHPVPMWIYNLKTLSFLAVNAAALAKYGYSQEEFLRMTIKDIRPAEDVPRLPLQHSAGWRARLSLSESASLPSPTPLTLSPLTGPMSLPAL